MRLRKPRVVVMNERQKAKYAELEAYIARNHPGGTIATGSLYLDAHTPMAFIDALGRRFEKAPTVVKGGGWSPYENKTVRDPEWHLAEIQRIAGERGGRVADGSMYVAAHVKMAFLDREGNRFEMTPTSVKGGHWSPYEARLVRDPEHHLSELRDLAASRGGRLADGTVYVDAHTKMTFLDSEGRPFDLSPKRVKAGRWSPFETLRVRDPEWHMAELGRIAAERGGRISDGQRYTNTKTKMVFVDAAGNLFEAKPNSVKQGHWSPYDRHISEHACRQAIEYMFGERFPSRWGVVHRPNGNKLQLDGYCEQLQVAFEYQGYKHWECDRQMERDADKRAACERLGILLVEVPDFGERHRFASTAILTFAREAVESAYAIGGKPLPPLRMDGFRLDMAVVGRCARLHRELGTYVATHHPGGRIAEGSFYSGSGVKMTFVDAEGNTFERTPSQIKRGLWTPIRPPLEGEDHMAELAAIASACGGQIAPGSRYMGATTKMAFIDSAGRRFEKLPYQVKAGKWSPFESGWVRDPDWHLAELTAIATLRGGRIAEGSAYQGWRAKMSFIDVAGHSFEASSNDIKNRRWSPFETPARGAKVRYTPDRSAKIIAMPSGDTVVYRVLEDGSLRIRGHIAADGQSMRRWRWDGGVATIEVVTGDMVRGAIPGAGPTPR